MKSNDRSEIRSWELWGEGAVRSAPSAPGVYVFRMANGQAVRRLKGESDIVYIGTSLGSLRKRLAQHLIAREDQTGLGIRIARVLQEVGPLEIGWVACSDSHKARWLESELLSIYWDDHVELPPLNRMESGTRLRRVMRLIEKLPEHERKAALAKIQSPKPRN